MRIGILTFHSAINYGAVLQTYALQKTILKLGHEVEIIDYENNVIKITDDAFNLTKISSIRSLISMIFYYPLRKKRKKVFKTFINDALGLSSKKYSKDNIMYTNDVYDIFCVGSDQVWNYDITGKDNTYFLSFVSKNKKKVSYAASLGYEKIPDKYALEYQKYISSFDAISIREKQAVVSLKELINKDISVVLDPTLLLNKEEWSQFSNNVVNKEEEYILLYVMSISNSIFNFAKKLSQLTGYRIVFITDSYKKRVKAKCFRDATPYKFVSLFLNAKYVVTNSFHGLAFAINCNKEFYVELLPAPSKVNSRLLNILELLNLNNRIIRDDELLTELTSIEWKEVNQKLNKLREHSINYLKKVLEG